MTNRSEQGAWSLRAFDLVGERYVVHRSVGRGAMATVVAAWDREESREVALKMMRTHELASSFPLGGRFLREASAIASIRSPHVARVFDVGTHHGKPYLVMELLDGLDLEALLASSGPLRPARAVAFVLQACRAIAEAHRLGILHRDLKPGNLFLCRQPDGGESVKVVDFGLAKAAHDTELTSASTTLGTPGFMAPEQWERSRDVDARADIWSLGATLYQLLTGELPFEAVGIIAQRIRVLHEPHTPLEVVAPWVPVAVRSVVDRCLQKDPADRFQTVEQLAAALEATQRDSELPRRRIISQDVSTPPPSPCRRRPVSVAVFAAVLVSTLLSVVGIDSVSGAPVFPGVAERVRALPAEVLPPPPEPR